MKKIFLLINCLLLLVCCKTKKSNEQSGKIPDCIKASIEAFSKTSCEKGLKVNEYTFQGATVFVFDQNACGNDMTSEVFDKNCKSLGFLGGFVGNVKIKGEDFSNALLVRTVWER
ncbi:DUF6970 domain-containing protein [Aurantibacillus circumpalustris]|uniref:DUF6970 domain-containing protein n=1 Tax=Aurantibacillus circumpalustris TaxID=3036359 RepID=UPI00295B2CB6|nr:hypothetical protein [Aurantibacillus circumpalustris]